VEIFVAVDGDNVGSRLEYFAITNNVNVLIEFSRQFNETMNWFEHELVTIFGANVIFCGGDNLLARIVADSPPIESLEKLRAEFSKRTESTLSIGLGDNPQQAYLALKLAKTNGKNKIRQFVELSNG
jgi:GTP cyclohydrolase III